MSSRAVFAASSTSDPLGLSMSLLPENIFSSPTRMSSDIKTGSMNSCTANKIQSQIYILTLYFLSNLPLKLLPWTQVILHWFTITNSNAVTLGNQIHLHILANFPPLGTARSRLLFLQTSANCFSYFFPIFNTQVLTQIQIPLVRSHNTTARNFKSISHATFYPRKFKTTLQQFFCTISTSLQLHYDNTYITQHTNKILFTRLALYSYNFIAPKSPP